MSQLGRHCVVTISWSPWNNRSWYGVIPSARTTSPSWTHCRLKSFRAYLRRVPPMQTAWRLDDRSLWQFFAVLLTPTDIHIYLHIRWAHLHTCMLIWKAVDKQDPTYASISVYGWEMSRWDNLSASTVAVLAYHVWWMSPAVVVEQRTTIAVVVEQRTTIGVTEKKLRCTL